NVGVLWQQGRTIDLGDFGGGQTWPLAINDRGQIVGTSAVRGSTLADPQVRAFLWENGKMTALPGPVNYFDPWMSIDPSGTHIVASVAGYLSAQLLLWTRRPASHDPRLERGPLQQGDGREAARDRRVLLARPGHLGRGRLRHPPRHLRLPPACGRRLRELRPAREDRRVRRLRLHRRLRRRARRRPARR